MVITAPPLLTVPLATVVPPSVTVMVPVAALANPLAVRLSVWPDVGTAPAVTASVRPVVGIFVIVYVKGVITLAV